MIPKVLIVSLMIIILLALANGLIFLIKDGGQSTRTVRALTWRIGLSLTLFLLLLVGFSFGLIQPHAIQG